MVRVWAWSVWSVVVLLLMSIVAYAQEPASTATAVMTGGGGTGVELIGEWTGSALLGFYIPRILEWLKKSKYFPLMQKGQFWLNRSVAIGVSVLSAVGVHATFTHADTGWNLHVWGPQLTIATFVVDVLRQFAIQEFFFDSKFQPASANNPPTV